MNNPLIIVRGLLKSFDGNKALQELDLEIEAGMMFGLIGPDGAGKTTLLRILCGLLLPDSGDVSVLGFSPITEQEKIKSQIGYMPQRFSLYPDLTVRENLRFFADIYGISKTEWRSRYERLMEFSRLGPFVKRKAGALSGGMKQKLALSCTLIHTPKLLILDEPTTGVDPVSRMEFWDILRDLKSQGVTILVTTPYMDEAALCDYAALMYKGKILARGTPGNIVKQFPHSLIRVYTAEAQKASKILKSIDAFESVELYGDRVHVATSDIESSVVLIEETLHKQGIIYSSINETNPNLEDTFVHLVKQES